MQNSAISSSISFYVCVYRGRKLDKKGHGIAMITYTIQKILINRSECLALSSEKEAKKDGDMANPSAIGLVHDTSLRQILELMPLQTHISTPLVACVIVEQNQAVFVGFLC